MSNLIQFFSGSGLKPIDVQKNTALPTITISYPTTTSLSGQVSSVLSGTCTAAILKTAVSVTGRGAISWLGVDSVDVTSRTHRLKITIDGVTVLDKTTVASIVANRTIHLIGTAFSAIPSQVIEGVPLFYDSSLLIEYASSNSETDKATISYINYLR